MPTVDWGQLAWWGIWGMAGGFIVEAMEYWRSVRHTGRGKPDKASWGAFIVAEVLRLLSGAIIAVALGRAGQISGEAGALAVGVAAPLIIDRMSQEIPKGPDGPPKSP